MASTYKDMEYADAGRRAEVEKMAGIGAEYQTRQNMEAMAPMMQRREEQAYGAGTQDGRQDIMGRMQGQYAQMEQPRQNGLNISENVQNQIGQEQMMQVVNQGAAMLQDGLNNNVDPRETLNRLPYSDEIKQAIVQVFQQQMDINRGQGREQGIVGPGEQGMMATANPEMAEFGRNMVGQMMQGGQDPRMAEDPRQQQMQQQMQDPRMA